MNIVHAVLSRGAVFTLLWWVLGEGRPDSWVLAPVGIIASTALSVRLLPPRPRGVSLAGLARFVAYFLWHSARGGVQVAALALRPRPDLAPQVLELPLNLPPGAPRTLITATIGLMPGTLGVRLEGDRLHLHVLDARIPAAAEVQGLQTCIARLFRVPR